MQSCKFIIHLR